MRRKKCDKLHSVAKHLEGNAAATTPYKFLNGTLLLLHWFGASFFIDD
jgi:hypothetical protein